jgi:hypothetical protein
VNPLPALLVCFARCCGMELRLISAFWFALEHAEGATAVQWRERLLLFESRAVPTQAATEAFWDRHMGPQQLVQVIEALVQEERLPREAATRLEEGLLRHVLADGRWH